MSITIHQALRSVSAQCDHARNHDSVGFSGLDATFANKIAESPTLSAKQEWYVARFVRKYRRQVIENYERAGEQITRGLKGRAKTAAADAWLGALVWEHQSAAEVAKATAPRSTIAAALRTGDDSLKEFVLRFPYSESTISNLKLWTDWRDRRFDKTDPKDPKWLIQPTPQSIDCLRRLVEHFGFVPSPAAEVHLGLRPAMQQVA